MFSSSVCCDNATVVSLSTLRRTCYLYVRLFVRKRDKIYKCKDRDRQNKNQIKNKGLYYSVCFNTSDESDETYRLISCYLDSLQHFSSNVEYNHSWNVTRFLVPSYERMKQGCKTFSHCPTDNHRSDYTPLVTRPTITTSIGTPRQYNKRCITAVCDRDYNTVSTTSLFIHEQVWSWSDAAYACWPALARRAGAS